MTPRAVERAAACEPSRPIAAPPFDLLGRLPGSIPHDTHLAIENARGRLPDGAAAEGRAPSPREASSCRGGIGLPGLLETPPRTREGVERHARVLRFYRAVGRPGEVIDFSA